MNVWFVNLSNNHASTATSRVKVKPEKARRSRVPASVKGEKGKTQKKTGRSKSTKNAPPASNPRPGFTRHGKKIGRPLGSKNKKKSSKSDENSEPVVEKAAQSKELEKGQTQLMGFKLRDIPIVHSPGEPETMQPPVVEVEDDNFLTGHPQLLHNSLFGGPPKPVVMDLPSLPLFHQETLPVIPLSDQKNNTTEKLPDLPPFDSRGHDMDTESEGENPNDEDFVP